MFSWLSCRRSFSAFWQLFISDSRPRKSINPASKAASVRPVVPPDFRQPPPGGKFITRRRHEQESSFGFAGGRIGVDGGAGYVCASGCHSAGDDELGRSSGGNR